MSPPADPTPRPGSARPEPSRLEVASDRTLVELWVAQGAAIDGGGAERRPDGVTLAWSGSELPFFNLAYVLDDPPDPAASLAAIASHYAGLDLGWVLWVNERASATVEAAAASSALIQRDRVPGMVLDPIPGPAPRPLPVDGSPIVIQEVTDDATLAEFNVAAAAGFGIPPEATADLFPLRVWMAAGVRGFLGRVDGEPVGTAMLFVDGDDAGVHTVSTLPTRRRGGIGTALTWAAIDAGRRAGATRAVLQASADGLGIYADMGFRTVCGYRLYGPATTD